jgi:hypothetical protein
MGRTKYTDLEAKALQGPVEKQLHTAWLATNHATRRILWKVEIRRCFLFIVHGHRFANVSLQTTRLRGRLPTPSSGYKYFSSCRASSAVWQQNDVQGQDLLQLPQDCLCNSRQETKLPFRSAASARTLLNPSKNPRLLIGTTVQEKIQRCVGLRSMIFTMVPAQIELPLSR